jgi:hypothetical protein
MYLQLRCRVYLPVGQNLQDHVLTMFGPFLVDTPESVLLSRVFNWKTVTDFTKKMRSGNKLIYLSINITKSTSF